VYKRQRVRSGQVGLIIYLSLIGSEVRTSYVGSNLSCIIRLDIR